jgi:hypothetical protein
MPDVTEMPVRCTACGGTEFWDNRNDKKNPKSPDFKCKDKDCNEGYWLAKGAKAAAPAPAARRLGPAALPTDAEESAQVRAIQLAAAGAGVPVYSFEQLKARHAQCVLHALEQVEVLEKYGTPAGSVPEAVIAMANTLFIERSKRGV